MQPARAAAPCPLRRPPAAAGTWQNEVEVVDGKIVITRRDGSQATLTYSEATSPAEVCTLDRKCLRSQAARGWLPERALAGSGGGRWGGWGRQ